MILLYCIIYGAPPHAPPTFLKKGWIKNFGTSSIPFGALPHAPPTFLKKGWIKNFGNSFVFYFLFTSFWGFTPNPLFIVLGFHPKPHQPFCKKVGSKTLENGFVLCFVFPLWGAKLFPREKFLRFGSAKNRNRASVFVPVQTSQRLFPPSREKTYPKTAFIGILGKENNAGTIFQALTVSR